MSLNDLGPELHYMVIGPEGAEKTPDSLQPTWHMEKYSPIA